MTTGRPTSPSPYRAPAGRLVDALVLLVAIACVLAPLSLHPYGGAALPAALPAVAASAGHPAGHPAGHAADRAAERAADPASGRVSAPLPDHGSSGPEHHEGTFCLKCVFPAVQQAVLPAPPALPAPSRSTAPSSVLEVIPRGVASIRRARAPPARTARLATIPNPAIAS